MHWSPCRYFANRVRNASIFAFGWLLVLGWNHTAKADNVLLIIADDLGADSIGLFSSAANTAPTPTLDNLAANGVRFTRCWSNPTCSPSRASLLTGRHGFRTGVGTPGDVIDLSESTLAHAFNNAGHATACIGKWHLSNNSNGGADNPNLMGFSHFSGPLSGGIPNYSAWTKVVNGVTQPQINTYATTENVNDALDWIDDQNGDWFLWLAFNAPHTPFHLPPANLHSYNLSGAPGDIAANPTPYYQATVEAMDTEIARLLNTINPAVLANTTIVFIGDNGTPAQVSPGTVRGAKSSLYEGGVHVPCIISGSAVSGNLNRTNAASIHFVDFFESLLELGGLDPSLYTPVGAATDSVSFADHVFDPAAESEHDCQFTIRFNGTRPAQDGHAIANDRFKLIQYLDGDEEFFRIANETTNLLSAGLNGNQTTNYVELIAKLAVLMDPPKVDSVVRDEGSIARPDLINAIEVVFNQHVNVAVEDLLMQNDTTQQMLDLTGVGFSYDATTFTATWDLSTLPTRLEPAFYTAELIAANVASVDDDTELDGDGDGVSGPNREEPLLVAIPGDVNLDGTVDVLGDAFALVANLNLSSGTSWSLGDLNADGTVNVLGDAFILVANLGRTLNP